MTEAANIPERHREEYEIALDIIAREKRKNRGKPDVWSQYRAWAETEKRLIEELGKAEAECKALRKKYDALPCEPYDTPEEFIKHLIEENNSFMKCIEIQRKEKEALQEENRRLKAPASDAPVREECWAVPSDDNAMV